MEDATTGLTLSRVICAADAFVKQLGISIHPAPVVEGVETGLVILEEIGLAAKAERIAEDFQKEYDVIKAAF